MTFGGFSGGPGFGWPGVGGAGFGGPGFGGLGFGPDAGSGWAGGFGGPGFRAGRRTVTASAVKDLGPASAARAAPARGVSSAPQSALPRSCLTDLPMPP